MVLGSLYFFSLFFHWRMIALQCCVSFRLCSKVNQLLVYVHPSSIRSLLLPPHPSHPSRSSQSMSYAAVSH